MDLLAWHGMQEGELDRNIDQVLQNTNEGINEVDMSERKMEEEEDGRDQQETGIFGGTHVVSERNDSPSGSDNIDEVASESIVVCQHRLHHFCSSVVK